MKEGFISPDWPHVDEVHACVDCSSIGYIIVSNHADFRRVLQLQEVGHGDLESTWVGFGGDVADNFYSHFLEWLKPVFPGIGINGYFKSFLQHGANMVYHRRTIFSGMMRAKGAIGIEKDPLNALCEELVDGNFLKPFYLHESVQPGRVKGQGNEPGGLGPGEAFPAGGSIVYIWHTTVSVH